MEEEWRVLGDRVRSTLLPIAAGTKTFDFLRLIKAAYLKLATFVYISRRTLMGATELELGAIPMPPTVGHGPVGLIESARLQFENVRRSHASAGRAFVLYGAGLGLLQQGDPRWQTWEGHHAAAIQNADGALLGLRLAAASCQAAFDAYLMSTSFPHGSPAWAAWLSAGQSLMLRAVYGVTTAANMVRLMRRAVLPEYIAVSMILYP
ncbi:unnamed protein product [Urochloa decumbens]|uniref:Uncharacterized protein n=1 Tax=Urochloa decumbens TaxID=240449 RepID=A0ABC8ZT30_9POAL